MLRLRILTAVVLLIPLLSSLMVPSPLPFALLTLLFIAAAGWEWGRLNQSGTPLALGMATLLVGACGAALRLGWNERAPAAAWWLASALWAAGGTVALRSGPALWPHLARRARWIIGVVILWLAWLAMSRARTVGINFMLSVFGLVWMADIAAYFGGKIFGRHKLAPSISPGKTWEGVFTGMAGVLGLALLWTALDARFGFDSASLYSRLAQALGWAGAVPVLLLLAGTSVVGDLVESLVKRAAGAKDSSRLLPGHGGVLDRIDALLPVFPVALALASV
jgi:phosphatidate cytidylyltransferase